MDIRCFIAINLPDSVRTSLAGVIGELKTAGADVKWVAPENIHITLKFLGNTDSSLIAAMRETLQKKIASYDAFCIKITGIGCFPSEKRPRVIWIGMQDQDVLKNLSADIDAEMTRYGFAAEKRPFTPHFTIGRVRSLKGVPDLMKRFSTLKNTDFGTIEIHNIHIMKSDLRPAGAVYTSLAELNIGTREE